jgi:flagellar motility protein MotE (MotC chaperone)
MEVAMRQKTVSNKFVALSMIVIILGTAIFLDLFGVVHWMHKLSGIPVIGSLLPNDLAEKTEEDPVSSEELELINLQQEVLALQKELAQSLEQNNSLQQEIIQLQETVAQLTAFKEQQELRYSSFADLAKIYGEMKPALAAQILAELKDEVVIEILLKMPVEQTSKILGQMNSEHAGRLTAKMVN